MLDSITVNDIVTVLQVKSPCISWVQFRNCDAYVAIEIVTIGDNEYPLFAIKSYDTVVGFEYGGVVYEVGKYSRTTSKQFIQIYNAFFPTYDRIYTERMYH